MATKTAQQLAAEAEAERTRSGNAQSSADTAQNRYVTHLAGGQDALNTYTQGAMSSAMPQLCRAGHEHVQHPGWRLWPDVRG